MLKRVGIYLVLLNCLYGFVSTWAAARESEAVPEYDGPSVDRMAWGVGVFEESPNLPGIFIALDIDGQYEKSSGRQMTLRGLNIAAGTDFRKFSRIDVGILDSMEERKDPEDPEAKLSGVKNWSVLRIRIFQMLRLLENPDLPEIARQEIRIINGEVQWDLAGDLRERKALRAGAGAGMSYFQLSNGIRLPLGAGKNGSLIYGIVSGFYEFEGERRWDGTIEIHPLIPVEFLLGQSKPGAIAKFKLSYRHPLSKNVLAYLENIFQVNLVVGGPKPLMGRDSSYLDQPIFINELKAGIAWDIYDGN